MTQAINVTIKDIAQRAGVSFSTVSKALRDSPLVQPATKQRIVKLAEEMGYVPNSAARRLVSRKSGAIGVVWPSVERVTPSLLITRINEALESRGYTTLISMNQIESAIQVFHRFQTDAILVFYEKEPIDLHSLQQLTTIPILCYGTGGDAPFPTLDVQRGEAIRLATRHLLDTGCRRIAYLGKPRQADRLQQEKVDAFLDEAHKYKGMQPVLTEVDSMEAHAGYLAARQLLQQADLNGHGADLNGHAYQAERPEAIISGSYDLTRGLLRAASECGLRVPGDLLVVSYDQIPQMAESDLQVTTVGVPVDTIAQTLARQLISLAEADPAVDASDDAAAMDTVDALDAVETASNETESPLQLLQIKLKPELVIRRSTSR